MRGYALDTGPLERIFALIVTNDKSQDGLLMMAAAEILRWWFGLGRARLSRHPTPFPGSRVASLLAEGEFSAALTFCRSFPDKDQSFGALVELTENGFVTVNHLCWLLHNSEFGKDVARSFFLNEGVMKRIYRHPQPEPWPSWLPPKMEEPPVADSAL